MKVVVLEDGPCGCCAKFPRGCTDGPSGPCCPCCSGTGREFWPYENQEAALVFAGATLAMANAIEDITATLPVAWRFGTRRTIARLRASVVVAHVATFPDVPSFAGGE